MATKRRRGAAKQAIAKQEAARKRSAPGKRFVGETAGQSARAKRAQRKKVARMARGGRAATRAEAARAAGPSHEAREGAPKGNGAWAGAEQGGQTEAAFRAAQADAALSGAEVEPLDRPLASVSHLPSHEERDAERLARAEAPTHGGAAPDAWAAPSEDVSREHGGGAASPLGPALGGLVRSGLGLARSVAAVPLRIAFAVPRMVLRAVFS